MAVDVKEMIDKVVDKAKNDPKFMDDLKKDPEKTLEGLLGVDIPDGTVEKVVDGIRQVISEMKEKL